MTSTATPEALAHGDTQTHIELTEAYAYDTIDFALDAIEEAEYAVLDAMYARAAAAALGV